VSPRHRTLPRQSLHCPGSTLPSYRRGIACPGIAYTGIACTGQSLVGAAAISAFVTMDSPSSPDAEQLGRASPVVLVVDDEPNIRKTLGLILQGVGYQVITAATAEEALHLLNNPGQPVDLVILDIKLPGLSGLDALKQLREE